jgi:hypothetical protein
MKLTGRVIIGLILILFCTSWGYFAHYKINRLAVFTLPKSMAGFYKANIEFITEHAVSADKKRYVDTTEAPRHYLNADHYGKNPFTKIPQRWNDAMVKYSEDTLNKQGTVPWTIQRTYYRLVNALKAHDTLAILTASANLGHYIADAHVPLHLTQNYNGQFTNQTGIHALFETRIPELFGNSYNYNVGKAHYIENPLAEAFKICRTSYSEVDSVLRMERLLNKTFPANKKMVRVKRGNKWVTDYSVEYGRAYQKLLKGMVQRRMRSAILEIGNYWYSAWVDAGQPDLNKLIKQPLSAIAAQKINKEEVDFKTRKR